jgi:catechol 2,3-dioxygenase-like lactoylglutathione lyase family enzyme
MALPPLRFYSFVLRVSDLQRMQDWYCRALGFTVRFSKRSEAVASSYALLDGAGITVELVCPDRPPDAYGPEGRGDRLGWKTLDLETDDLKALDAHLRAQGATIIWSMQPVGANRACTLVHDPEGNNVAIFGPPA